MCLYVCMYVCVYVCMYDCMCACMCAFMCVCTCVCMCLGLCVFSLYVFVFLIALNASQSAVEYSDFENANECTDALVTNEE